jgi:hypothetical protein
MELFVGMIFRGGSEPYSSDVVVIVRGKHGWPRGRE